MVALGLDRLGLVLWEIAAIYTHYFAFFLLFSMSAWLLLRLAAQPEKEGRTRFWTWLAAQGTVLVAFLLWLSPALARARGHVALGASPPQAIPF